MNRECYVCANLATKQCETCGAVCCKNHYEKIHKGICKVGKKEKVSRLDQII